MRAMPYGSLPEATWPGHTFNGWYTASEGGEIVLASTPVNKHMTIYAHWIDSTYIANLDINLTSSQLSKLYAEQSEIEYGDTQLNVGYNENINRIVPPRINILLFKGYYDSRGKKYINEDGTSANKWDKTENVTLYAKWESITFRVTVNYGSYGNKIYQWKFGDNHLTLVSGNNRLISDGWYEKPGGQGTKYAYYKESTGTEFLQSGLLPNIDSNLINGVYNITVYAFNPRYK